MCLLKQAYHTQRLEAALRPIVSLVQIRIQLSKEMMQDLGTMTEENNSLMRETLLNSLSVSLENVVEHPVDQPVAAQAPAAEPALLTEAEISPKVEAESAPVAEIEPVIEAKPEVKADHLADEQAESPDGNAESSDEK